MDMDYRDIEEANKTIKTKTMTFKKLGIKKSYVPTSEKIRVFRMLWPQGFIRTELVPLPTGISFKASVGNGNEVFATGYAYITNKENDNSAFEKCETSAIGRALSNMGIGNIAEKVEAPKTVQPKMEISKEVQQNTVDFLKKSEEKRQKDLLEEKINQARINTIRMMCERDGVPEWYILKTCSLNKLSDMKEKTFINVFAQNWDRLLRNWRDDCAVAI